MIHPKLEEIAKIAYSHKETVYHTYNTARDLLERDVPGIFVECGVGAGAQIMAMKLAVEDMIANRSIFGFDSFQGIPLAGPQDTEQPGIGAIKHDTGLPERERLVTSGITVHSKENVEGNFKKYGVPLSNVFLVKGWFQDTLPNISAGEIALLRLDGDLYESTICCLDNLYEKVVKGGVVIIDDNLRGVDMAIEDFFHKNMPELNIVPSSGGVRYFIKT